MLGARGIRSKRLIFFSLYGTVWLYGSHILEYYDYGTVGEQDNMR